MYNLRYIRSDGAELVMTMASGIIISHVVGATGRATNLKLSTGFDTIGENVDGSSVGGCDITISGKILDGNSAKKRELLRVLIPNTHGRLIWEDELEIEVYLTASPEISQTKHSTFALTFHAPYPYWRYIDKNSAEFGSLTAEFSFPVNYNTAHRFGTMSIMSSINAFNRGDFDADYELVITVGTSGLENGRLENTRTGEFIGFDGAFSSGDVIHIWRENGELRAEKTLSGVISPAFDVINNDSTLFYLHAGDNPLRWSADGGAEQSTLKLSYYSPTLEVLCDGV